MNNLVFKFVAFLKLFGEGGFVVCHALVELILRDVDIVNLDVEVLTGGEAVLFLLDFVESKHWRNRRHSPCC